ncbi:hypothetical protein AQJ43_34025 [Streptomyces avermitilis]|uniref:Uncharacterized protein n=2 Tax=Streptomyces avermitilis TaxID=33903 RepID=Q82G99_STRAW|nr:MULTISPECIES: hypothetical protein [Streptomyces]KUN50275.1 hypothetical protein AQJ43_34025 [Streptomyces avermitilis]MYS99590.1 hypothetical protein [Streptomyces sp. SID5469]OOV32164.1 hypothetical protein SM007_04665 [Streptomyces avermitilis]BAC71711.1 hypothetical protein SAVERM_3999 [Streptomyces avermitilis MA-4680 = NBRC 14893]GDY63997.1 hypothetical protein SAV14893_033900 [Streptomyces avermitilis]
MTVTAESFVGRVIAVFSRRSPGFRPPSPGTPGSPGEAHRTAAGLRSGVAATADSTAPGEGPGGGQDEGGSQGSQGLRLARATSPWKSTSSHTRLWQRRVLLELFAYVRAAHRHAAGCNLRQELDFVRSLAGDLALVHDAAVVRTLDTAVVQRLESLRGTVRDLVQDLGQARELAHELVRNLRSAPSPSNDRNLAQVLARTLDEIVEDTLARDVVLVRGRASVLPADRDLILVRNLVFDLVRVLDLVLDLALVSDLAEARDNLSDAANNFMGADVTDVDPAAMNLAWIRWNRETRWPTREWADRIRRASVESPPGSGIFTVLPEQEYGPAEVALVH